MVKIVRSLVLATLAGLLATSAPLPASAQGASQCQPSGPYMFPNLLATGASRLDNQNRRSIAVLGTRAFSNACTPRVVCVSFDNSKASFEDSKLRCKTVREALVISQEGSRRERAKSAVILESVRPEDGFQAGSIQITMQ